MDIILPLVYKEYNSFIDEDLAITRYCTVNDNYIWTVVEKL